MKFQTYADREMMMIDLAQQLAGELGVALRSKNQALLAVPGGTTPGPVFDALCGVDLDWARVRIVLTDERWVPEDHPRSNAALVRRHLLADRAAAADFQPYYRSATTPDDAVADLEPALRAALPIDVLLLGMGVDMHTASLFAGNPGLQAALAEDAPALMALHVSGETEPRVTLTAPALSGALNIHVVITGKDKRAALERAAALGDPQQAPIAAILKTATVHWAE